MKGIGLALGGGGIMGCCHVGVICAMEEEGIPIDCVAGTSAGAMVAVLYASGYSGQKLAKIVPDINRKLLDYDYWGLLRRLLPIGSLSCRRSGTGVNKQHPPGLIKGAKLHQYLLGTVGERDISDLQLPFAVMASDLAAGQAVLFANRPVATEVLSPQTEVINRASAAAAALASMSIPGVFPPVHLAGRLLVDGGIMDNCPSAAAKALGAERIVAINLVSARPVDPPSWTFSTLLTRSLTLCLHRMSQADHHYSDLVLAPDAADVGLLEFSRLSHCMEAGYRCAKSHMDVIRRIMAQAPAAD